MHKCKVINPGERSLDRSLASQNRAAQHFLSCDLFSVRHIPSNHPLPWKEPEGTADDLQMARISCDNKMPRYASSQFSACNSFHVNDDQWNVTDAMLNLIRISFPCRQTDKISNRGKNPSCVRITIHHRIMQK